jgi:hypothetical protein
VNTRRKRLTFEQAEGVEPLPTQLRLKEMSPELRALSWEVIYKSYRGSVVSDGALGSPWETICYNKHVRRDHKPADDFINSWSICKEDLKVIFALYDYSKVLGFVQWVLRQPECPSQLAASITQ